MNLRFSDDSSILLSRRSGLLGQRGACVLLCVAALAAWGSPQLLAAPCRFASMLQAASQQGINKIVLVSSLLFLVSGSRCGT